MATDRVVIASKDALRKRVERIAHARRALTEAEESYLRAAGWEPTSEMACTWLWRKTFGKTTVYMGTREALRLESGSVL